MRHPFAVDATLLRGWLANDQHWLGIEARLWAAALPLVMRAVRSTRPPLNLSSGRKEAGSAAAWGTGPGEGSHVTTPSGGAG
jgi:hypothetical protein